MKTVARIRGDEIVLNLPELFDTSSDDTRRCLMRCALMDDVVLKEMIEILVEGWFEDDEGREWGWISDNKDILRQARNTLLQHADDVAKTRIEHLEDEVEEERQEKLKWKAKYVK